MPKEAILNFICIDHLTTCQQLHQEQSVQGAGQQMVFHPGSAADAEIRSPHHQKAPEMDTWIKPEETSPFGSFHKKWGYPQNG